MSEVTRRRGDLEVLQLEPFSALGVDVVVTTRAGGVSVPPYDTLNLGDHVGDDPAAVRENRNRLATALAVASGDLVIARQVHGTAAAHVRSGDVAGDADVVVTTDPRVAICVLVADCVPLVVVDPIAKVLCVAHAGWRGTTANVAGAAVDAMASVGAEPDRCYAGLGPCISKARYQVGDEVADALAAAGVADAVVPDGTGRFLADLSGANRDQLVAAGVPLANVYATRSTTDDTTRFFSHRSQRPCGRFALAARLAEPGS